jgi:G3E family GTPase
MIVAAALSSPTILDSAMPPRVIANALMSIMATALLFCCIREDGRAMREEETYTLGQSHSFGQKYFTPFASRVQTKDHERPSRRKGVVAFEKRPRRVVSRRSTARVKQSGRRGHKMRSFLEFPPPGNLSDQCDDERRTDRVRDRRKIRPKAPPGAHAGLGTVRHDDDDERRLFFAMRDKALVSKVWGKTRVN